MDHVLFYCGAFSFLESRHWRQAQAHLAISLFFCVLEQLEKQIVHDAIRRIRTTPHQVPCDFIFINRDEVYECEHLAADIHGREYRRGSQILGIKIADGEAPLTTARNSQPFVRHVLHLRDDGGWQRRFILDYSYSLRLKLTRLGADVSL